MPIFSSNQFDPNTDIPDLDGKVYVITGGSAGIGFGIVAHILQHNAAKILLLSNKKQHAEEALEELQTFGDTSRVHWIHCDLSDLKQTDQVAKSLAQSEKRIDALICNAGLGVGSYWETVDGLEAHFQVNHLSQMHLALTMLPILRATPNSRLIFQSSDLHRAAPPSTSFASISEINKDIGPMLLYNRTKLAQVLFAKALARKIDAGAFGPSPSPNNNKNNINKIFINATHPGAVNTDQQEQAVEAYGTLGKLGVKATRPFMKDPVKAGCRSALFAACSEDVVKEGVSGEYIVPDRKVVKASDQGRDEALGERLWMLSEEILREKLGKEGGIR